MTLFPQAFSQMLSDAYGPEIAACVLDALGNGTPSVSIRYNPSFPGPFAEALTPIPWSPHGFLLAERPNFTLDPLFHAGCYYVQDSSAMFVGHLLRGLLDQKAPGTRVLDLCAAPGGKTTDAAASLRERYGDGFTLLANEVMRPRFSVLRSNVRCWGDPRVGVVSRDPAVFGAEGPLFDIVIADVPCSGEGMFRKDPRALAEWSPETVAFCAARQRRILSDVWPALRPGGFLLYATCTFNPDENDRQLRWICEELGAAIRDMGPAPEGILRTPEGGYALLPGLVPGEGQFAAVLQKSGEEKALPGDPFRIFRAEVPAAAETALAEAPEFEVDRRTALDFLHGDALRLPEAPLGLVTLTYRGRKLGQVKNIGSRCNNLYPKDRRIRMDIPIEL